MAKMGRIVTLRLGKIDKKAMQRFLDDSLKGLIAEKEKANPKEFDLNLRYTDLKPMSESMGEEKDFMRNVVKNFNTTAWIGYLEPF